MKILLIIFLLCLVSACATPKTINGQKVIATRWVNGQVVYILAPDIAAEIRGVKEGEKASKGFVIGPVK